MKYKRVLLKLSGEALMGSQKFGIDPQRLEQYTNEIKKVKESGVGFRNVEVVRIQKLSVSSKGKYQP